MTCRPYYYSAKRVDNIIVQKLLENLSFYENLGCFFYTICFLTNSASPLAIRASSASNNESHGFLGKVMPRKTPCITHVHLHFD